MWGIIFGAALMGLANATGSFAAYTNNPLQAILHGNLMVLLLKGLYFIFSVGDFSLTVRRFRDAGLNAWWSIVMLIPFVDLTNLISGYGFAALYAFVSAALFFFMMYVGLRPSMEDTEDYYAKH
ncbi:hypothetical protein FC18_GL001826 [Lacticaseibacillus sharpeae JCM 1186 = DSM 20505]|uniref:Uncharacterized protein n=1 Tax=Lacticaseibacillus sharpeae JCM 1186 = DSM 20505 TaxID=1291052 RepID=A0A0R1ZIX0_9LACO|nr:hypothetical protein FC18_GL001826 [Lacticaseibacillus sharpeae JCM 1186 = DSM 20505]